MTLDADQLLDRRRLKRRLAAWQIVAVVALVIAGFAWAELDTEKDHVARLTIDGIIFDDADRAAALDGIAGDDHARALIIAINSPGGTFVGGEATYRRLREIAKRIPVVAVMGNTATSAGYMIAIGADHIIAHAGTITGSIGVIMQTADLTGLLEKLGIKPETVKSGALKAQPNPLEPFEPVARAATKQLIQELHGLFVDMVAERRPLERDQIVALADGRIFSGRQAKAEGLIDAVGAETLARDWLVEKHGIDRGLPLHDVPYGSEQKWWRKAVEGTIGKALFSEQLRLDGVVSLWHPGGW